MRKKGIKEISQKIIRKSKDTFSKDKKIFELNERGIVFFLLLDVGQFWQKSEFN